MPNRLEREKRARIACTREILAAEMGGEWPSTFADILFEHAAAEDLIEYEAGLLAEVVKGAFAFFRRRSEAVAVRIGEVPAADTKGRLHSVIEIATANRPFIFDSVLGELQAAGRAVRLVVHPILEVRRDNEGWATAFAAAGSSPGAEGERESFVHVHVPLIRDPVEKAALAQRLTSLLHEVRQVTEDWPAMRATLRHAIGEFRRNPPPLPEATVAETAAFLEWLEADNFVFLGTRAFSYAGLDAAGIESADGEGLGMLRDPSVRVLRRGDQLVTVTPEVRAFLTAPEPLIVTKANVKSRVHRRNYMDYVGLKRFEGGAVSGELRVVGLFTSEAFTRSTRGIPLIGPKVARLVARAGFDPLSHSGKTLLNILEHYPRTELFQASEDELFEAAMAILQLEERPRVRALARRDRFDRFVSVLVFVPRDRYSSELRERIGQALAELYNARVSAFFPDFSATHLTRVQFILGRNPGGRPEPGQGEVEARIRALLRTFADDLVEALEKAYPPDHAAKLQRTYAASFDAGYRAAFTAAEALADIAVAETLEEGGIAADFAARPRAGENQVRLRLHHLGAPIPLSRRVPLLENLGFSVIDERTHCISRATGRGVFLHDMTLNLAPGIGFSHESADRLRKAVAAVWSGRAENDGFNALILTAGLDWREAALLRAVGRYLRQTNVPYSIDYIWAALARHAEIAGLLMARFALRFGPHVDNRDEAERETERAIDAALERVPSLDDDTILRAFSQVIAAALRTDFYAPDAGEAIALKLDPKALPFLPLPRPFREIFVHAPDVDGIHMRFGPVARGGLRWSDRPQDFRTEVLGLAKAQQVKNAVIVPVGAKGGFVPKRLPAAKGEAAFEAGRAAYIRFVDRLLAVTDDIEGEAIMPPAGVVCRDGEDPYLVVAADKGTATFSDTANAISLRRGFWLGDAFASGGSAGYDHKAMGITALGAWEAVKRHFREMDIDIQASPFTVAGVGDMSGDVFGNAMLLSPWINLVAAFDHRDIFIDPDPDPARSLKERRRLFALPRSSWQDYDRSLLSPGGGVFSRAEKQISLSDQAVAALGLDRHELRPAEIISAILQAPVDLLWFGGIGTYVRGPGETNADVGDKANDAVRVSAADLRGRVVGEGANLAMTQKARIAYGLKGGRCNLDAIDNSAGVNTSDMEVNIKIAMTPAMRSGRLPPDERLALLGAMTGEVASLVLRNNYQQTLAISLEERRGAENLANQMRLMAELEARDLLDREVEGLAGDAELEARGAAGQGLTRAEIGVLLAFAKIALTQDLVASDVPDDPYFARELLLYFPQAMRERFAAEIGGHRLRREIVATQLANSLVNRGGPTLLVAVRDRTGASSADLTRAYAATRDAFGLRELHGEIEALDSRIPGQMQLDMFGVVQDVLIDRLGWFARKLDQSGNLESIVATTRAGLIELTAILSRETDAAQEDTSADTQARLSASGVPRDLTRRLALLPRLARASDVVFIAERAGRSLEEAAVAFATVSRRFGLDALEGMAAEIATADYYESLALQKARDSLEAAQRGIACAVLGSGGDPSDLTAWERRIGPRVAGTADQVNAILAERKPTTAKVSVAASLLAELAGSA